MATGGQDGRVVIWNLSTPSKDSDSVSNQFHSAHEDNSVRSENNAGDRMSSESPASSTSASSDDLGDDSTGRESGSSRGTGRNERVFSGLQVCNLIFSRRLLYF